MLHIFTGKLGLDLNKREKVRKCILNLKKQNKSNKDIVKIIKKKFPQQIIDEAMVQRYIDKKG
jgi:hypothetical protein